MNTNFAIISITVACVLFVSPFVAHYIFDVALRRNRKR
jgi:hypothetical protein